MQELKDGLAQKIGSLKANHKMIILPINYDFPYTYIQKLIISPMNRKPSLYFNKYKRDSV